MKKTLLKLFISLTIGGIIFFASTDTTFTHASGGNSIAGNSSSPGDGSDCQNCHGSYALKRAPRGWISSNIPAAGYTPGATYTITCRGVSTASGANSNFGFECSPQDLAGTVVGTLANIATSGKGSTSISSGTWVTHTGTSYTGTDSCVWTFKWTAPSPAAGYVKFYASFNCGSADNSSTGHIYDDSIAWPPVSGPLANFTASKTAGCPGMTVNFTDKSTSNGTVNGWKWTFTGGTPATSAIQNPSIVYNTPGTYNVKLVMTSTTGKDSTTKTGYITVASTQSLPLSETFQSGPFPPTGWVLNKPIPGDSVWQLCTTNGYNSTQCMFFPANCGNIGNITGQRQQLYTPNYSFAGVTNAELSFDVAYEPSSVTSTPKYSDTLDVYYSLDCGSTWTMIYSKGGMTLCTTGSTTSAKTDVNSAGCFVPPNTTAWRRDSISLAALNGKTGVMFSFESRSGWGNIIYLDNINIPFTSPTSVQDITDNDNLKAFPNPFRQSFTIQYTLSKDEPVNLYMVDIFGRTIPIHASENEAAGEHSFSFDCSSLTLAKGIYVLELQTGSGNSFFKMLNQ